jgi:drug/metabolite transporter (DMT)-like permease
MGVGLNQFFFLLALTLTTATNTGILNPSASVFAMIIAVAMCWEKLSLWKFVGFFVTVLGALIVLEVEKFDLYGTDTIMLGNFVYVIGTFCFATYLVFQKPVLARIPALTLNCYVFVLGWLIVFPVVLIGYWNEMIEALAHLTYDALSIVYSALVAGVGAYTLNSWAIGQVPASLAALFLCLQSFLIAFFAFLLLGEELHWRAAIGGLFIMAGLIIAIRARTWEEGKGKVEEEEEEERKTLLAEAGGNSNSICNYVEGREEEKQKETNRISQKGNP